MRIEIDQSGKIEDTHHNTVIAFSNDKQRSIFMSAKDKRVIQSVFRRKGKHKVFVYKMFAFLVSCLLRGSRGQYDTIVIDVEYEGKEAMTKSFLMEYLGEFDKDRIHFCRIGKGSRAHERALAVFRGELEPDIVVAVDEVLSYIV